MKPVLSVLFIDNDTEYKKLLSEEELTVELISISSTESISTEDKMNYAIAMSKGEYVCCVLKDDILLAGFLDEVMMGIGSKRDAILFGSFDSGGESRQYSTITRRYNLEGDGLVMPMQYFHPVKRRILRHIMFVPEEDRNTYKFYSKKISQNVFSEYNIKKELIRHDPV